MLWLGLSLLTLVAVMTIVRPLVRVRKATPPRRAAFDRAIYRDQLAELRRDLERGVLDAEQAESARIEIERRLLATEEPGASEPGEAGPATLPVDGITAGAVAAAVSAGAIALYLALGSPNLRDSGRLHAKTSRVRTRIAIWRRMSMRLPPNSRTTRPTAKAGSSWHAAKRRWSAGRTAPSPIAARST